MIHPYALAAVVVGGLALTSATFYYKAKAADARADAAVAAQERLEQALLESEANNAELRQRRKDLDAAIRERDKRYAALQEAKRTLDAEYEKLRGEATQEDQACLDRDLPPAFAERLRH